MAFPRILWNNAIRSASSVTASSTDTGYAIADIYDFKGWKKWQSGTVVTGITIDIDMGSSSDYASCLGLVNHNITSEGGTIEVRADPATNPPTTVRIAAYTPTYGDVEMKDFSSHAACRYYRIVLAKGGNFTNKPFIGELWLGNPMVLPEYLDPAFDPFDKQTEASIQQSGGGHILGVVMRGRTHQQDIPVGTSTGMARSFYSSDVNTFIDTHYDVWRPFFFQVDSADSDFSRPTYRVKPADGKHRRQAINGMWNRMALTLPSVEAHMEAA